MEMKDTTQSQHRLISESSGILDKRLDGGENSSIFISCQIFISKQNNIDI